MRLRPVVLLGLSLASAMGFVWLRSARKAAASAEAPAAAERSSAPLPAEGYQVQTSTVRQTVPAVGTLIPNESVTVVGESARRVAQVHFEEGALVAKGALIFKLDDAELRAELARLTGRRGLLSSTEARLRQLIGERLVSQQEYDRAASELQAIEGEIEVLKVAIAKTEIRAPFAGRLGLRRVSEGAYISPNTPLTTLQDLSQLKLDFTLPERYADEVRPGQAFSFKVEGRGETLTGKVVALEPQIDPGTRSLLVRGVVPNRDGRLQPGASAAVEMQIQQSDGILVPARALLPGVQGHTVFVLKDGKAHEQPVTIGVRTAEQVQILVGLAPGDTVLTSNLLRLRTGATVRLLPVTE